MAKTANPPAKTGAQAEKVRITLTRSLLGRPEKHRRVAKALGLTKTHRSVEQYDTPIIRGMINTISHLLQVESASEEN